MAVIVISASWTQKLFDSYFLDIMYVEFLRNVFLTPIRASKWQLDSHFGLLSPKTFDSYFLRTWCTSSSWKIFFPPIRATYWLLDSFWPPEPKNVWFLLSRHDVPRVHEKFSSRRFERADGCYSHFGLLSRQTFDFYFLDMMYIEFESARKNFGLSPIRGSSVTTHFGLLNPKTFDSFLLHMDIHRVHEKFFSRRFTSELWLLDSFWPPEPKNVWFLNFLHMMYVEFMKNFFSPIRASWWLLQSFRPSEPKNVWFLLSRHDVHRVHKKYSSRLEANGC